LGIRAILEGLRDSLANSTELTEYCQTKFGKPQTVFLGYNPEKPPTEEDWPAVVIAMVDSEIQNRRIQRKITVGFFSDNETIDQDTNAKTYRGFVDSEELREVTEEVALNLQGPLGKIEIEAGTEDNLLFPLFTSLSIFTIENIVESR